MGIEVNIIDRSSQGRPTLNPKANLGLPNTIELRAKIAVEPPIVRPDLNRDPKHLFFVYTNDKGQKFYIAGYPAHDPDWGSLINSGKPLGDLVHKGGEYQNSSSDYKDYVHVATISGDP